MHLPQYIIIGLYLCAVGAEIAKHGEPKTGKHNAILMIIAAFIIIGILYWGGFFK